MRFLQPGVYFLEGDEAAGLGAILAGCRFYAGYPITPASEIMEFMARYMPKVGGVFIQMEDEIASIAAVIGASWAGMKAMTATSGPGFSLMQENIGLAFITETPLVIINVQRVGPSTGRPTKAAQGDLMQTKFGTHGDYMPVALYPDSPQEMLDLTIEAFNISEMLRTPVIVLSDEIIGHLRERVEVPEKIDLIERKTYPEGVRVKYPFDPDEDLVPKFTPLGHGHRVHITGLSHSSTGYPVESQKEHDLLIRRLFNKILRKIKEIFHYEVLNPDAKIKILTFGCVARSAKIIAKRHKNIGLIRLKTIWPLNEEVVGELIQDSRVLIPEMNLGQMFYEIKRIGLEYGAKEIKSYTKIGGEPIYPNEILEAMKPWL